MSYLCSRFPQVYRCAAFLALMAMLVPMATMLAHHSTSAQIFTRICAVEQTTHGDNSKSPTHHHQMPSCPICQTLHLLSVGFVPPDAVILATLSAAALIYKNIGVTFFLKPHAASLAQPRAPPVSLA